MAGTSLLTLIDDIATLLDDVAILSKVAAKKTAGVLGDDLAVNAEQVSGIRADRELPVVWAVFKGSLKNKLILVPAALLISAFAPWAVTPLLMLGGAYLCFEGVEKILHSRHKNKKHHQTLLNAVSDKNVDMVAFEKNKIEGAVRTDFILSAEIIAITLGTVADQPLTTQVAVLSFIAIAITFGVYGLVAGIVKMDDAGLYLKDKSDVRKHIGKLLLAAAPKLMKFLSIFGTLAMFLVGGGILVHGVPSVHHAIEHFAEHHNHFAFLITSLINALVGMFIGALCVAVFTGVKKWLPKK